MGDKDDVPKKTDRPTLEKSASRFVMTPVNALKKTITSAGDLVSDASDKVAQKRDKVENLVSKTLGTGGHHRRTSSAAGIAGKDALKQSSPGMEDTSTSIVSPKRRALNKTADEWDDIDHQKLGQEAQHPQITIQHTLPFSGSSSGGSNSSSHHRRTKPGSKEEQELLRTISGEEDKDKRKKTEKKEHTHHHSHSHDEKDHTHHSIISLSSPFSGKNSKEKKHEKHEKHVALAQDEAKDGDHDRATTSPPSAALLARSPTGIHRSRERLSSIPDTSAEPQSTPIRLSQAGAMLKEFYASYWSEPHGKWFAGKLRLFSSVMAFLPSDSVTPGVPPIQINACDIVDVKKKKTVFIFPFISIKTKQNKEFLFRTQNRSLMFKAFVKLWKGTGSFSAAGSSLLTVDDSTKKAMQAISKRYEIVKKLGKGAFGAAYVVQDKFDFRQYVLKRVACTQIEEAFEALKEMLILKILKHPYIVGYKNFWQDEKDVFIVMEYCQGGDLEKKIKEGAYIEEKYITKWLAQLCLALQYMHDHLIIHQDIKPSNVFLNRWGTAKFGDFGLSTLTVDKKEQGLSGTLGYIAPEVLKGKKKPSPKSDVYSLGASLYELFTLQSVFEDENKGVFPQPFPEMYSKEWQSLVSSMMSEDPDKRPSLGNIMSHPFVQGVKSEIQLETDIYGELQQREDENNQLMIKIKLLRQALPQSNLREGTGTDDVLNCDSFLSLEEESFQKASKEDKNTVLDPNVLRTSAVRAPILGRSSEFDADFYRSITGNGSREGSLENSGKNIVVTAPSPSASFAGHSVLGTSMPGGSTTQVPSTLPNYHSMVSLPRYGTGSLSPPPTHKLEATGSSEQVAVTAPLANGAKTPPIETSTPQPSTRNLCTMVTPETMSDKARVFFEKAMSLFWLLPIFIPVVGHYAGSLLSSFWTSYSLLYFLCLLEFALIMYMHKEPFSLQIGFSASVLPIYVISLVFHNSAPPSVFTISSLLIAFSSVPFFSSFITQSDERERIGILSRTVGAGVSLVLIHGAYGFFSASFLIFLFGISLAISLSLLSFNSIINASISITDFGAKQILSQETQFSVTALLISSFCIQLVSLMFPFVPLQQSFTTAMLYTLLTCADIIITTFFQMKSQFKFSILIAVLSNLALVFGIAFSQGWAHSPNHFELDLAESF